ncbi:hypothetical protein H6758_00555 [Candidatus Nomurabacteria bacterium]|nr:hypothetical protein [Candidatus Nomurabacteria bacterium]
MKKRVGFLRFAFLLVFGFAVTIGPVFASVYEWINPFWVSKTMVFPTETFKVLWTVNTSDAYGEYTALYYKLTEDPNNPPANWNRNFGCSHFDVVDSSESYICYMDAPTSTMYTPSTTLWIRVTTNYSGCGQWTPNPDVANCGDVQTTAIDYFDI